jgi:hypothetical protein
VKYTYTGTSVSVSGGAFGYVGDFTDIKKIMHSTNPMNVEEKITSQYKEYVGSLDFQMKLYGVLLQGEYAKGFVYYNNDLRPRVIGGNEANYARSSGYGLLGYTLPLHKWLGDKIITPFFMYQYSLQNDLGPNLKGHLFSGGINFRPSPYVVLKVEYMAIWYPKRSNAGFSFVAGQMAVAF